MGLCVYSEDEKAGFDIGYGNFAFCRMWIADCLNAEAGEIYKKLYLQFSYKYSQGELNRMKKLFSEGARTFLYHCDCEGELSAEECELIVRDLSKIELRPTENMPPEAFNNHKKTWQSMFKAFEYAATHRVKLCFA